jgi:hypothetical protein
VPTASGTPDGALELTGGESALVAPHAARLATRQSQNVREHLLIVSIL